MPRLENTDWASDWSMIFLLAPPRQGYQLKYTVLHCLQPVTCDPFRPNARFYYHISKFQFGYTSVSFIHLLLQGPERAMAPFKTKIGGRWRVSKAFSALICIWTYLVCITHTKQAFWDTHSDALFLFLLFSRNKDIVQLFLESIRHLKHDSYEYIFKNRSTNYVILKKLHLLSFQRWLAVS